ncbi:hypothetical protein B0O79_3129 [Flavobacteriaceae bacterium MAR_2009_75]|nr:hypothetical protein B0O79_3129 [Flavobacteriaceae bacterium MAR_2009_75]
MIYQEINAPGNFTSWETSKLTELKEKQVSTDLGQSLLFENDSLRIWEIFLQPGERMGFRKITNSYNLVSMGIGLSITRCEDGSINLYKFNEGDTLFINAANESKVQDLENIGDLPLYLNIMEFKSFYITCDEEIISVLKER